MFRLTVIAGPPHAQPARGSTFAVGTGSFSIGRHSENEIVLHSTNVSKKHCVLVVNQSGVSLEDQGSSNGTFINGRLASKKSLHTGDRISVGEFVFELTDQSLVAAPAATSNVLAFPGQIPNSHSYSHDSVDAPPASEPESAPMPKDILGKLKFHFDRTVLPYFLGFNERFEWRVVIGSLFGLYLVLNLFVSLSPLMSQQEKAIEREVSQRAKVMAHELAERNTAYLAANAESKLDLGSFGKAWGVRVVTIIDLDNKILAPADKAGRYFDVGSEALTAVRARKLFNDGKQDGLVTKSDSNTIVAIEPIQVLNPAQGKNHTVAMAVVSVDTSTAAADGSELWLVYSHTLVLSIAIGLFIFYLIYRITIRPFQEMNRKIDQVLRGESMDFKSSVHFSEIDSLWDVVDSALKRVPRGDDRGTGGAVAAGALSANDLLAPLRSIGSVSKSGVAVLDEDRRVLFMNSIFEEITGIRLESSEGQPLAGVVRDQAFSSLVSELCERASPGTDGASEDFEFSGMPFQMQVVSFGHFGDPKCFVFTLVRKED